MSRKATPAPQSKEPIILEAEIARDVDAANQLATMHMEANASALAVANQVGYEGAMTVGALEDEIRFYQRRTVEAILETGKRLLVLKELTPFGEFSQRVEMLGIHIKSAQRLMSAASKTAKSDKLSYLSGHVKNGSAFLELITHDDDVIDNLAQLDKFDRMSASQLRYKAREMEAESEAKDQVLADKNTSMDKLRAQLKRIQTLPADEALDALMKEATAITRDAMGAIRGGVRQALIALNDAPDGAGNRAVFMAGLVGQVQADLNALREEFNLPDVSNAADQALAAEVAQWAK